MQKLDSGSKFIYAIVLTFFCLALFILSFFGIYKVINSLDLKAFYRYASDGKFTTDVYFTEASKEGIKLEELFGEMLPETVESINRPQDLYQILLGNEKLLFEGLRNYKNYVEYLKSKNLVVEDAILYMKKISKLDDVIMKAAIYLTILFYIFALYFLFKWRLQIFILSGLVYFVLVIDSYMSGIFLDAFFPFFTKIYCFFNYIQIDSLPLKYEDYKFLSKNFLSIVGESALTFIIFDTAVESIKNAQKNKRRSRFLSSYLELETTIKFLGQIPGNLFVTKLKTIDMRAIYRFCREDKSDKYLSQTVVIINEYNKIIKTKKITVIELHEQLIAIQNNLRRSAYFRNNIIS